MNKLTTIAIIPLFTVLLQWHSVAFWMEKIGASGIAFSFALEAALLWLWYFQKDKKRFIPVRYLAFLLLIAGPWYQLTGPAVEKIYSAWMLNVKIEMVQKTVMADRTALDTYNKNSDERTGWAGRIDRTQARLDKNLPRLESLLEEQAEGGVIWREHMFGIMMAVTLLIILITELTAVTYLRNITVTPKVTVIRNTSVTERKSPGNGKAGTVTEDIDAAVKEVATEITRKVEEYGSRAKVCQALNLRPANVSLAMNHESKKAACEPTITSAALAKLKEKLFNRDGQDRQDDR